MRHDDYRGSNPDRRFCYGSESVHQWRIYVNTEGF